MTLTRAALAVVVAFLTAPAALAALPHGHVTKQAQVTLKMHIEIDGVKLEEKGLTLPFGRSGAVGKILKKSSGDGTFVEVTPRERPDGAIEISFLLGKFEHGKRTLSSGPTLVTRRGVTATYMADAKRNDDFRHLRFSVTPY